MVVTTKMLLSNVIGHAAELQYEKYLTKNNIKYEKAPTDTHYDYVVNKERQQVKRFESASTTDNLIGINLTKTHGDRSGVGGFYKINDFDSLVFYDVDFLDPYFVKASDIPRHAKDENRLKGKYIINRPENKRLGKFHSDLLKIMKIPNEKFYPAIEEFRDREKLSHKQLLEKICNLDFNEIDSLFCDENFRLIVGVKGFAAEEYFNVFLDGNNIPYKQIKEMYSKVDHLVKESKRIQVKTIHSRSTNKDYWGFKTHKSHGSGEGELYKDDEFDYIALFIGNEMDETYSKYFPKKVINQFILIPTSDLEKHPKHPGYLKRVSKVPKNKYKINDTTVFD